MDAILQRFVVADQFMAIWHPNLFLQTGFCVVAKMEVDPNLGFELNVEITFPM